MSSAPEAFRSARTMLVAIAMAVSSWPPVLAASSAESVTAASGEVVFQVPSGIALSADRTRFESAGPVSLSGQLALPTGKGPFPLVVLAHGCDGVGPVESGWAGVLQEWGYATLLVDSLSGRGLDEVCTDARALRPIQRVPDAFSALHALAAHPMVKTDRAMLMGFSHGGATTLVAATSWAKERFAPSGSPAFSAFIAFYPANCNVEYPERTALSAPVRIHVGELDDWTPAAPCVRLGNAWKAARQDGVVNTYPGAHHAFDYPDLPHMRLPDVDNGAACTIRIPGPLGPLAPPVEGMQCVTKGATIAGNREATEKAEQALRRQLQEFLE